MHEQLAYWVPRSGKSLPEALREAGAHVFAERIRSYLQTTDVNRVFTLESRG